MLERLIKLYKARRLRKAREDHAYWKARHEALAKKPEHLSEFEKMMGSTETFRRNEVAQAAANEARYLERVETYVRDQ